MSGETDGGAVGGDAASSDKQDEVAELSEKFAAFCEIKTKNQFTPKACNKLVKDCFADHYKFRGVILTNRIDSSVFSRLKEDKKQYMNVTNAKCKQFLQFAALEFAKLKKGNDKLPKDDPAVQEMYDGLHEKVMASKGPVIKSVKQSATGNVKGLTDTSKYTGSHKLRFDETGKGRGKAGRSDTNPKHGYVEGYKGEGTFEEGDQKTP